MNLILGKMALKVIRSPTFNKKIKQLEQSNLNSIVKLIKKIIDNPTIGKAMSYERKGTREVYMKPFRLSYEYDSYKNILTFLNLYHKKFQ